MTKNIKILRKENKRKIWIWWH